MGSRGNTRTVSELSMQKPSNDLTHFIPRSGVPIQLPSLNMMLKEDGMVLAIRSIREDASDTYSCVARNLAGLVSAESKISVLPKGIYFEKFVI